MRMTATIMLSLTLFTGPASAAMFKWKDANGNIQYGQRPPPGIEATRIKSDRTPKQAPGRQPLQEQVKQMEARKQQQQAKEAEAAEKKQDAKLRKQNCENARSNITQLGYGGHRLTALPDGSYKRLTDAEKQQMIEKNRKAVEAFCD